MYDNLFTVKMKPKKGEKQVETYKENNRYFIIRNNLIC